uniref:Ig-like domain-containing protein n=1 Tax=Esox lucius TaxID=8010 RepID=A0AAY5K5F1_ESOLU
MEYASLLMILVMSTHIYAGQTPEPKAVLTANPWPQIFSGETVTLKCKIQGKEDYDWEYNFNFNNRPGTYTSTKSTYRIGPMKRKRLTCTCVGMSRRTRQRSLPSEAVTLTLTERPKAVLSVLPAWWLNVGGSVNLSCVVEPLSPGWRFSWYKKDKQLNSAQLLPDSDRGVGGTYSLSPVGRNHTGEYRCRGERRDRVLKTELSKSQFLWVEDHSHPASLIVTPDRSQHFKYESVSVSCEVQGNSTGWRLKRYKNNEGMSDLSADIGSLTVYLHDTGVYWCESESGEHSNAVNITVADSDLILESPALPVTEGESVTMRCRYQKTPFNFRADFYKGGSLIRNETTGEMTISAVSKSDEGLYKCEHQGKKDSPASWLTVRGIGPRPSNEMTVWLMVGLDTLHARRYTLKILEAKCCG